MTSIIYHTFFLVSQPRALPLWELVTTQIQNPMLIPDMSGVTTSMSSLAGELQVVRQMVHAGTKGREEPAGPSPCPAAWPSCFRQRKGPGRHERGFASLPLGSENSGFESQLHLQAP